LIFNGILHVAMTLAEGLQAGSGVLTGGLLFIPSFCWMVYVVLKSAVMSGKALAVSVSGGIIAHILLAAVYGLQKAGVYGSAGVLWFDLVVIAVPILVGWAGSKLVGTVLLRPPRSTST
jgi:hypothetical protein